MTTGSSPLTCGMALEKSPIAWTTLRLVLSGLALILPWCLYVWLTARR